MAYRKKHPSKDIEAVIKFAEKKGWRILMAGGSSHCWGRMLCPFGDKNLKCRCGDFCSVSIWSTPRNVINHASQLRKAVMKCVLTEDEDAEL